ncbi:MAG: DUF2163 domain-containing protein [Pseudomonadota bacterium]
MSRLPQALSDHLAGQATTVCAAWTVTLSDGTQLGFTDHDNALTVEGVVCEPGSGFRATEAASQLGMSIDDQEIEGALSGAAIDEADVRAGRFDRAQVDVWLVNWADPTQQYRLRRAHLGRISQIDGVFRAELQGLTAKLSAHTGRSYTRHCDAVLGDARCGVDLTSSDLTASVTVSGVRQSKLLDVSGLEGFAEHWFAGGEIKWLTGANTGRTMEIASDIRALNRLTLWEPMADAIAVGDTATVSAGCDKRFTTCKAKFFNHLNFRGFPHMPGDDFVMGYADGSTLHDGSPIVP